MKILYSTFYDEGLEAVAKQNLIDKNCEDFSKQDIEDEVNEIQESDNSWFSNVIETMNIHNWLLIGETQFWDGKRDNHGVFGSFSSIVEKYDDYTLSYKKVTDALTIELYHHDGKHTLKMYSLDEADFTTDLIYFSTMDLKTLKKHSKAITAQMYFDAIEYTSL